MREHTGGSLLYLSDQVFKREGDAPARFAVQEVSGRSGSCCGVLVSSGLDLFVLTGIGEMKKRRRCYVLTVRG